MSETAFATALDTLGTLLPADPGRDAVHLATYAVVAAERLFPGQHIGLKDGKASASATPLLGIVDPFLATGVHEGQMFWLVLYPRTITSLRHVWEHKAFEHETAGAVVPTVKPASEQWMRNWASKHMSADYYGDYDTPLDPDTAYNNAIRAGENMNVGPYEDARDHIDNEWWGHWEAITGKAGQRGEYFSCAC